MLITKPMKEVPLFSPFKSEGSETQRADVHTL